MHRTLSLKREVLQELTPAELTGLAGAGTPTRPTGASCLDYISCWALQCLAKTLLCVE
jgi:hypothetical protein